MMFVLEIKIYRRRRTKAALIGDTEVLYSITDFRNSGVAVVFRSTN